MPSWRLFSTVFPPKNNKYYAFVYVFQLVLVPLQLRYGDVGFVSLTALTNIVWTTKKSYQVSGYALQYCKR